MPDAETNKYYVKEACEEASQHWSTYPISVEAPPTPTSAVADAPLRPFLLCGCGVQQLDGAEVRDWVARWMTSQEPACLRFPSSDAGVVVLLLDTMLEATTGHLCRTKGKQKTKKSSKLQKPI